MENVSGETFLLYRKVHPIKQKRSKQASYSHRRKILLCNCARRGKSVLFGGLENAAVSYMMNVLLFGKLYDQLHNRSDGIRHFAFFHGFYILLFVSGYIPNCIQ